MTEGDERTGKEIKAEGMRHRADAGEPGSNFGEIDPSAAPDHAAAGGTDVSVPSEPEDGRADRAAPGVRDEEREQDRS